MKPPEPRSIALFTILSALCIGIQLTPRPPNVEFTSLLVFLAGTIFGSLTGSTLGASVMFINGFLSPWGFAGLMLPFQMVGMAIVGCVGGFYGRTKKDACARDTCGETAVLGVFLTVIYELITNFGVAVSNMLTGLPLLPAIITAAVFGAPFSLVHVASNCLIFFVAFFPLVRVIQQFFGGEITWRKKSLPI